MANLKVRKDGVNTNIPDTLIPLETTFTGSIETSTSIRIDGRVKGNVNAKGDVALGSKALVEGDVFGRAFNIAGTITGNVVSTGSVALLPKARVLGDIVAKALSIELGASYSGKCIIGAIESARMKPGSAATEAADKK
ncbi:MAG: polymer-forming cytoskeletal protein [Clostridia bacterium]|jgi:cytoskeletal protein CcmA (bactofilin family)|nr:polymer-forming cytoskeletal protein [Clostridia bacterium]MBT7122003.1 polymer-forming cytoskeletal protein [Clostridia bacterium]